MGVETLLVHGGIEEVGSGDVELPEVIGLPWREGMAVNRLDVGKGQEQGHLQAVLGADALGEIADIGQVEDVAAQGERGFEMVRDQEAAGLGGSLVDADGFEALAGEFHAGLYVVLALESFS